MYGTTLYTYHCLYTDDLETDPNWTPILLVQCMSKTMKRERFRKCQSDLTTTWNGIRVGPPGALLGAACIAITVIPCKMIEFGCPTSICPDEPND